ncbi:hypothetical protein [Noviherbaspirillum sedimenti]|uniref:hypothetical protein n=1 Tax=Noviherbaspirillum sedimenti TaxID=2320865 RepID=UPI001314E825|nr:hypothetical protein [Noviherbaspirillum sedimenti]
MENIHQPTKEQIREWLANRRQSHAPLPEAAHIRQQLGWEPVDRPCEERPIQQAA